ncbi:uncharacterized protein PHACADRAFT_64848, partial [Phanerochaete carnosa HHB-10118-sp]
MSRETFDSIRRAFTHKMDLSSWYVTNWQAALLADLKPQQYDCCVDSCIYYAGQHADLQICPYCNQPRFRPNGRPHRQFTYIPLIPRLCAFYQSLSMVEQLQYRSTFVHDPNVVSDVFSSERYREMLHTKVVVDEEELKHAFFSDPHDIAFGLCTNGFLLFGRRR